MKFGDAAEDAAVQQEAEGVVQQAAEMHAQLVNLVEQGFEPPLHIVTLSATGAMTLGRWELDGEAMAYTPVTHYCPPGVAPADKLYILVVDAKGEATTIYREKVGMNDNGEQDTGE